jgi:hypothetical protein
MNQLILSSIVFSEWLPTGVMVHFQGGVSVFFSAGFLYEQRQVQPNQMFLTDGAPRHKAGDLDEVTGGSAAGEECRQGRSES